MKIKWACVLCGCQTVFPGTNLISQSPLAYEAHLRFGRDPNIYAHNPQWNVFPVEDVVPTPTPKKKLKDKGGFYALE